VRKRSALAAVAAVYAIAVIAVSGFGQAFPGGRPGDGNEEYDCGSSCHSNSGTGTITASSSTLSPTTGQSITVTVTVTPGELSVASKVGVFLVRQLSTSNSMPSVDGWVITADPNGGLNNYVEMTATVGTPVEFTWTLAAPITVNTYTLYARAHHGGGNEKYLDLTTPLTFNVHVAGAGAPSIVHTPPQGVRPGYQILINATLVNATSATLSWKNTGMASYLDIPMTNSTVRYGPGWIYQAVIPPQNTSTTVSYKITATGPAGSADSTYSIRVAEPTAETGISSESQLAWILSVVAVTVVVAGITIVVSILFGRRLRKGHQGSQ